MHARIDGGDIKLLTRTGLDWSHRYERTIQALHALPAKSAYLDASCVRSQQKTSDRRSFELFRISDALSSER